jgi:hypothetical protein
LSFSSVHDGADFGGAVGAAQSFMRITTADDRGLDSYFQAGKRKRSGKALAEYPRADIQVGWIDDLVMIDRAAFSIGNSGVRT